MADAPDKSNKTRHPARRGFAAMDPEKRRAIARLGGAAVPADKRSFSLYPSLAASAGRKGGFVGKGAKGEPRDPV